MGDSDISDEIILDAVEQVGTPCYIVAAPIVRQNLARLQALFDGLPVRHLLSAKTQPVRPLLQLWNRLGLLIDVVSEFELLAAIEVGFPADRIVINGVGKHAWLPRHDMPGLCVHFDSVHEATTLAAQAHSCKGPIGLRLNLPTSVEVESRTMEGSVPNLA